MFGFWYWDLGHLLGDVLVFYWVFSFWFFFLAFCGGGGFFFFFFGYVNLGSWFLDKGFRRLFPFSPILREEKLFHKL